MGSSYTNVLLPEPDVDAVAAVVERLRRRAYVAGDGTVTVVYDALAELNARKELERLATRLSSELHRPALAVANHHDDAFEYLLVEHGVVVDRYNSYPGFLKQGGEQPTGGDARRLCAAFAAAGREGAVDALLRRTRFDIGPEIVRHEQLLRMLGLPEDLPLLGYEYVSNGELAENAPNATLRTIGGAPFV